MTRRELPKLISEDLSHRSVWKLLHYKKVQHLLINKNNFQFRSQILYKLTSQIE